MTGVNEIPASDEKPDVKFDPEAPPREIMITTAVHFLQNPRIQSGPLSQKRAFLVKKGLTNEEIDVAIERAGVSNEITRVQNQALVPSNLGHPKILPISIWSRANRFGSSVVIIGIALYGVLRFYKLYIEPWLYGSQTQEDSLSHMKEQLLEVNRSLSQLKRVVAAVEVTLSAEKEKVCSLCKNDMNTNADLFVNPMVLNEIRTEVASLKSLMLSRRQFPAAPIINRTIPSWQLASSTEEKQEVDSEKLTEENTDKNLSKESKLVEHKEKKETEVIEKNVLYEQRNGIPPKPEPDQVIDVVSESGSLNDEQNNTSEA